MDSDQRRKRKRLIRPTLLSVSSVRSLLLFFTLLSFLYFLSHYLSLSREIFRPVLVVSKLPLLTSHSRHPIRLYSDSIRTQRSFVEDRVLFPDHLLLIVSKKGLVKLKSDFLKLKCVYTEENVSSNHVVRLRKKVLSFDDFNGYESIVRCPVPPQGYSFSANLEIESRADIGLGVFNRTVVHSWDNLAYTAVIDENTVVVFVKGLNLRPGRESDPNGFSCHFGFKNDKYRGDKYVITTRAVSAAQEVVRCRLPRSLVVSPNKAKGMRVTVGSAKGLVPSTAKIFDTMNENVIKRHELCVCTMLWNQTSALREWVTYHSWLGVEKWFIYDNNSDDGIERVVNELDLENYNVSRHVWPWIKTQEAGFSHCALRAKSECNWVGFMDVDEYFYFNFRNQDIIPNQDLGVFPGRNSLRTLVLNYSSTDIAEIRTSCHSFGPSGLKSPPSQGVMIGYTCRLQSPERHKSIVRPEALELNLINVVHHFRTKKGFKYVNLPQSIAVINHYKYQVWESFRAKFYRRVATYVSDWRENQNEGSRDRAPGLGTEAIEPLDWRLRFCEVWDTGLRDFVLAHLADPVTGLVPWEKNAM